MKRFVSFLHFAAVYVLVALPELVVLCTLSGLTYLLLQMMCPL